MTKDQCCDQGTGVSYCQPISSLQEWVLRTLEEWGATQHPPATSGGGRLREEEEAPGRAHLQPVYGTAGTGTRLFWGLAALPQKRDHAACAEPHTPGVAKRCMALRAASPRATRAPGPLLRGTGLAGVDCRSV
jgi:hypothetical protein